jgi:NAD(P)H dehydrogenase (quinone)
VSAPTPLPDTPIRHLVILGHPHPDGFSGSVARAYCEAVRDCGQEATLRDLYALGFDPLLSTDEIPDDGIPAQPHADLEEELALLRAADIIVLVYPIWFGMPPAIIKGYVDRVLGAGFTPTDIKQGAPHPMLAGKRLALFTSSASTRPWLEEMGQWRALHRAFDTYLQTVFALRDGGHVHFDAIVPDLKEWFFRQNLAEVRQAARQHAAELFEEHRAKKIKASRERSFGRSPPSTAHKEEHSPS